MATGYTSTYEVWRPQLIQSRALFPIIQLSFVSNTPRARGDICRRRQCQNILLCYNCLRKQLVIICQLRNFSHSDRSNLDTCWGNLCNYCVEIYHKVWKPNAFDSFNLFLSTRFCCNQTNAARDAFLSQLSASKVAVREFFDKGAPAF